MITKQEREIIRLKYNNVINELKNHIYDICRGKDSSKKHVNKSVDEFWEFIDELVEKK